MTNDQTLRAATAPHLVHPHHNDDEEGGVMAVETVRRETVRTLYLDMPSDLIVESRLPDRRSLFPDMLTEKLVEGHDGFAYRVELSGPKVTPSGRPHASQRVSMWWRGTDTDDATGPGSGFPESLVTSLWGDVKLGRYAL